MKKEKVMQQWQLAQLQSLPLSAKIWRSQQKIMAWYRRWKGKVFVSFSGGKDSTVLLHLVREVCGLKDVLAVFLDTGNEYPEIRDFVKTFDNVEVVRPKKNFRQVLERWGYPVISKEIAHRLAILQNPRPENQKTRDYYMSGRGSTGKKTMREYPDRWKFLIDAPFKASDYCCDVMKKDPIAGFMRRSGLVQLTGEMACDSNIRNYHYLLSGCNGFNLKKPKSTPLGFWLEDDVWEYLRTYNVPYSSIYDKGADRTGCMFCMFGISYELAGKKESRFDIIKRHHPKIYNHAMEKLGFREVISFLRKGMRDQGLIPDSRQLDLFK